jgi:hypothetical protein
MDSIDKIKNKIKKLFALSRSPNAHEAATALAMAQKLMAEYGVQYTGNGEFEVIEDGVRGNSGKRLPSYEAVLISRISQSFGCRCAWGGHWHFFAGLEHRVKTACFVSEVLLRKLRNARNAYIKTLSKVKKRQNKTSRADSFCTGWVMTVISKIQAFANTPDEQKAINKYVESLDWGGDVKTINRNFIRGSSLNDFANGKQAAAGVQIQHGVEGRESEARLLEGARRI